MELFKKPSKNLTDNTNAEVVSLFSGQVYQPNRDHKIVRLSPEFDHIEALYSDSHGNGEEVYRANILFWALLSNGSVVGMIPWLDRLIFCNELIYPGIGAFLGYFDPGVNELLTVVPEHKYTELKSAADHFHSVTGNEEVIVQELPDTSGTHVIFSVDQLQSFTMREVFSWQLLSSGKTQATVINLQDVESWPVLMGDAALSVCQDDEEFYGFLQYQVAVALKQNDSSLKQHLRRLISSQGSYAKLFNSHIQR